MDLDTPFIENIARFLKFIKTLEEIKAKYGDIHIVNFEDEYTEEITAIGVKQFEDATVCFI